MKYLRNTLIGLALLAALVGLLLWFLPASWVLPWIELQLHGMHLQQVHGSAWDGEAGEVTAADGKPLGRVQWQLSRRALLGDLRVHLAFDGPKLAVTTSLRRLPHDQLEATNLRLRADLALLDAYPAPALGRPHGQLQLSAGRILLQGGWPLQLQADGLWQHAAVQTEDGEVALGEMQFDAKAQGGVIEAQWHDVGGGPLQARGQLQLSPLGWCLDATLRARALDPALQRWLARVGPTSPDGSVHVQQSGGLAQSPPAHAGATPP
ncbi:MAG: type II secretion system protein N [Rhodanobacter sp.]